VAHFFSANRGDANLRFFVTRGATAIDRHKRSDAATAEMAEAHGKVVRLALSQP